MTQPTAYAKNNLDAYTPPTCPRCAKPASFDWLDISRLGGPGLMMSPGRHWCDTPNCVDEFGYNSILPYPVLPNSHLQIGGDTVAVYANEWKCLTCGATGPNPGRSHTGGWDHLDTHGPARRRRSLTDEHFDERLLTQDQGPQIGLRLMRRLRWWQR